MKNALICLTLLLSISSQAASWVLTVQPMKQAEGKIYRVAPGQEQTIKLFDRTCVLMKEQQKGNAMQTMYLRNFVCFKVGDPKTKDFALNATCGKPTGAKQPGPSTVTSMGFFGAEDTLGVSLDCNPNL